MTLFPASTLSYLSDSELADLAASEGVAPDADGPIERAPERTLSSWSVELEDFGMPTGEDADGPGF